MEHKDKINRLIDDFMLTDNVDKMLSIVKDKIDGIGIVKGDYDRLEQYYLYAQLFELLYGLKDKRIGFIKSGLMRFREQDTPVVCEILKQVQ